MSKKPLMLYSGNSFKIKVGGRASPLSHAQIAEVLREIQVHHPQVDFEIETLFTHGDRDHSISLRSLGQTDFFTREVDELLLSKKCRIAIHSAKDLPASLHSQFSLICLTKGVATHDVLVLKEGKTVANLKKNAKIGTSSHMRETNCRLLRDDFVFQDIRGTIEQRLTFLENGVFDGVIIAEAALIRLNLTHLNRVVLPGTTTLHQGRLAILSLINDTEMQHLFACIDAR